MEKRTTKVEELKGSGRIQVDSVTDAATYQLEVFAEVFIDIRDPSIRNDGLKTVSGRLFTEVPLRKGYPFALTLEDGRVLHGTIQDERAVGDLRAYNIATGAQIEAADA